MDSQMDVGVWEPLPRSLDKVVHEFIILLPTRTGLSQTQIKVVVEKLLILQSRLY